MVYSKIAFNALKYSVKYAEKVLARQRAAGRRAAASMIQKPKLPRPGKKKKTTRRKK